MKLLMTLIVALFVSAPGSPGGMQKILDAYSSADITRQPELLNLIQKIDLIPTDDIKLYKSLVRLLRKEAERVNNPLGIRTRATSILMEKYMMSDVSYSAKTIIRLAGASEKNIDVRLAALQKLGELATRDQRFLNVKYKRETFNIVDQLINIFEHHDTAYGREAALDAMIRITNKFLEEHHHKVDPPLATDLHKLAITILNASEMPAYRRKAELLKLQALACLTGLRIPL